jgi:hypothetical protein
MTVNQESRSLLDEIEFEMSLGYTAVGLLRGFIQNQFYGTTFGGHPNVASVVAPRSEHGYESFPVG